MTDPDADLYAAADDIVAAFQIDDEPVRGRIARLGPATMDVILRRHAYPDPVAKLLGEAITLVALVGSSMKFDGKLILQVQGEGPVSFLVAEYRTNGSLRGYAHCDERAAALVAPGAEAAVFFGQGTLALTIDQGPDMERYQGIVPLEGRSLSECAESYFAQSEQVPTRVRLSVEEADGPTGKPEWRAGGVLLQQVAGDSARGDTAEAWSTAQHLFSTLADEELTDAHLSGGELLYRLFHEEGVRLAAPKPLEVACTCTRERVAGILAQFGGAEAAELAENDGAIRVRCEYCNISFEFDPAELKGG
jgi:molecular chaperone Hsp33